MPSLRAMRMPVAGGLSSVYAPPRQSTSRRIASRWIERSAIANGDAAIEPEMLMRRRAAPGNCATKASTTMPPSDGPITVSARAMPRCRSVS